MRRAATLLAFALAACLVSERPIIVPADADYPLPPGDYAMIEEGSEPVPLTVWHSATDTVVLDPDGPSILRFRQVSDDVYAMQSNEDGDYLYGAIRLRGDDADLWLPQCAALTQVERRDLGLRLDTGSECRVQDWETLAAAIRIVVAREAPGALLRAQAQ